MHDVDHEDSTWATSGYGMIHIPRLGIPQVLSRWLPQIYRQKMRALPVYRHRYQRTYIGSRDSRRGSQRTNAMKAWHLRSTHC